MSLLLDALKKAADEKEKLKSTEEEETEVSFSDLNDSEDMDLDLDMSSDEEVYPQIDETTTIAEEQSLENVLVSDESLTIEELDNNDEKLIQEEAAEEPVELEENEIVLKDKKTEATDIIAEEVDTGLEHGLENEPEIEKPGAGDSNIPTAINKEALSELINKSNQFSRRNKVQSRILIGSITLLIFLVAGVYLYFEYTAGSQDAFMADGSRVTEESQLNRSKPTVRPPSAVNNKVKEKEASKLASVDMAKPKQNVEAIIKRKPVKKPTIKIIHKVQKDPVEVLIYQAYSLFKQGDYKASEKLYKKIALEEPKNRDALLGLAANAVKQQRYEYARQKYLQLRNLNPKDSVAIAGLSAIENKIKPELNESEIKFMLREQPDSAHLYFALGSIYADQKRWADAQASFFSAWSAENANADYAFNLAVSLDQLGKKMQAKQLYELSLKLYKENSGNFSRQIVEKRIKALNENSN